VVLRIKLLGLPRVDVEGEQRDLAGKKPWALLAYVVLAPRAPSRRELAELLFPEAGDPLASERWALLQVRRALGPEAGIIERDGRLVLEATEVDVDARSLSADTLAPEVVEGMDTGELLEGFTFDDAPAFEQWIALERRRVASAARDALRWAATLLARTAPERALALVARATALEPFDDALHELAVDIQVTSGDLPGARAYVDAVDRRYRSELGQPAPATLRRPLERNVTLASHAHVTPATAARALLETAQTRLAAGEYQAAVDAARRAATQSAATGDAQLEARALVTLGTVLIHSVRGHDREAIGLMTRAFQLANDDGDTALASEAVREIGYVSFLEADYGAAEGTLRRAVDLAERAADDGALGKALTFLGATQTDTGDLEAADATLRRAIERLTAAGDARWRSFAVSFLARAALRAGRVAEGAAAAAEATAGLRASGWHSAVPWALVFEGEAALRQDDRGLARDRFAEAFALGSEMGDPCWEGLSLRGLAALEAKDGHRERAAEMLAEAHTRCTRVNDTMRWAEALILTDLVELERPARPERLAAARRLTEQGPMPDLAARLRSASKR
jgi:DNA-binding SARP family transcriptional activator